jgi:hypothetical protein
MMDFDLTPGPDPARPACVPGVAALQRLLDGEGHWDTPEAAAHRAICAACREELALSRSLMRMPDPAIVPADLANRIVERAIASRRRRRIAERAGLVLALAASVLIVVVLTRPTQRVESNPGPVAVIPSPKSAELPKKPLGESVSEARDAIVNLTKRTASETRERSAQLMPSPKLPDGPAEDRLDVLADARVGASKSVEPMRDSARRAFNFILRAADPSARPNAQ